jgi:hypothetical protein
MDETPRDHLKAFEDAWKKKVGRAPETPPEVAARRILARLPERRAGWLLLFEKRFILPAAALVLVGLAIGVSTRFLVKPLSVSVGYPSPSIELNENMALIWLDDETPLYMTLSAPEEE